MQEEKEEQEEAVVEKNQHTTSNPKNFSELNSNEDRTVH